MMRGIVFGLALLVLGAAGVLETRRSLARVDPLAVATLQAKLDALPSTYGEWQGERVAFDTKMLERANAAAHVHMVLRHAQTRDSVSVLLIAGAPGEIGSHDPNRCYAGAGFERVGPAVIKTLVGHNSTYWQARFATDTFPAQTLQVNWSWSANGDWIASTNARLEFVGQPVLYKMYISRNWTAADNERSDDPVDDLLNRLIPTLRETLAWK